MLTSEFDPIHCILSAASARAPIFLFPSARPAAITDDVLSSPPPKRRRRPEEDADVDVDVDLLSSLHDDVLASIITLLPTKDGARTQILSRRWRPLWRAAPLNLEATVDTSAAVDPNPQQHPPSPPPSAVVGALQAHPGPVRRVAITWLGHFDAFPKVDDLLGWPHPHHHHDHHDRGGRRRFPCLDGGSLRELELYYRPTAVPNGGGRRHAPPMATLLRFSRTLRVLTLCCAAKPRQGNTNSYDHNPYGLVFPAETDAACRALELPSLAQLTLKHVAISEAALHAVLARCPALRSLVLHKNEGCARLVVTSPTLRSLGVSDGAAEVVVEDAPLLERLILRDLGKALRIRVVHAPRLKTLGYLCHKISQLDMGTTTVLKGMVPAAGASSMIRTVKILAVESPGDLDAVIDLLKCFPCVEKLYMELDDYDGSINVKKGSNKNLKNNNNARHIINNNVLQIECLDTRLKVLELRNYRGRKSQASLIRFLLANARVLESVRFMLPPHNYCKGRWIVSQRKKLLLNFRASRGARFHFEISPYNLLYSRVPMEHIHNLAIDDPFGRSSCNCQYDDFK